jgi:hypothetical protein
LNLALHAAASDQGGVKPRKDVRQRQAHQNAVPIIFGRENLWHRLAQFTKGNLYRAARQLRENLFQRHRYGEIAHIRKPDLWLQL